MNKRLEHGNSDDTVDDALLKDLVLHSRNSSVDRPRYNAGPCKATGR